MVLPVRGLLMGAATNLARIFGIRSISALVRPAAAAADCRAMAAPSWSMMAFPAMARATDDAAQHRHHRGDVFFIDLVTPVGQEATARTGHA